MTQTCIFWWPESRGSGGTVPHCRRASGSPWMKNPARFPVPEVSVSGSLESVISDLGRDTQRGNIHIFFRRKGSRLPLDIIEFVVREQLHFHFTRGGRSCGRDH